MIAAMNKKEKEKKARQETPIIDGDARPDMPLHPDTHTENTQQRDKKFEKERMSDVNSLEDYKDARLEGEKKEGQ